MEQVISKDGTKIAYKKTGNGPPLILIDGAMCNSSFGPMPKLSLLLSNHFTVITYDRRGRGDSADNISYSPEREVEDIEALINEINDSVFLFGMSSGAILSLMTAAKNTQVKKLVLYEPPFEIDGKANSQESGAHYRNLQDLISIGNQSGAVKYFMKEVVQIPRLVVSIISLFPVWKKMKANANSLPYDLEIVKRFSLQNLKSASILTHTLVVHGGKSPEKLQRASNSVSNLMPNGRIQVLEGQTHNVSTKVLAPVIIDFLNNTQ